MVSSTALLAAGLLLSCVSADSVVFADAGGAGRDALLKELAEVEEEAQQQPREDAALDYHEGPATQPGDREAGDGRLQRKKRRQRSLKMRDGDGQTDTGEQSADRFRSMFITAKRSLTHVSRRVYAKGEDYWKDPRRRRALGYAAIVAALMIIMAYAEHRDKIFSIEIQELEQRQSLVASMETETAEELTGLREGITESAATRESQVQQEKELQCIEENIKKEMAMLRDRMAALQQEQVNLSIREAKAQLSTTPHEEAKGLEGAQEALERLREIREAANRLFWQGDILRTAGSPPAMSDHVLLEADVRSQFHTMQRVMALEELPFHLHESILKMQQKLSDAVATLEIQLHGTLRMLKDDLWVAKAEKRLLKNPEVKEKILKGLAAEWASEDKYQKGLWDIQQKERAHMQQIREDLQKARVAFAEETDPDMRAEKSIRLFIVSSRELYKEAALKVLDAETADHKTEAAWMEKMRGLLEEADIRAKERSQAWATTAAANAELNGRINALQTLMESLDDKVEQCTKIHKTWKENWGISLVL